MKWKGFTSFAVVSSIMVVTGGCATQGVVKSDASLASQSPATTQSRQDAGKVPPVPATPEAAPQPATGKQPATATKLEPIANAAELKAAMEKIYFNFDSSALSPQARESLVRNSEIMKRNPSATVRIEGNCDERGSDEYNLALGEQRAKEAMKYLTTLGIPAERLTVISYGKEKPVATGHDESSWAANRRDDFVLVRH